MVVQAIIFDCFGVLYQGSLDYLYNITPRQHHRELRDLNRASDYGYISHSKFLDEVGRLTGLPGDEIDSLMQTRHVRNQPLIDLIVKLKKNYKIGLLSNIAEGVLNDLFSPDEQAELFDAVVLSSSIGATKPSPATYESIAVRLGLDTRDCLMVDDIPANIDGAQRTGMPGVIFYSTPQFEAELAEKGLIK